MNNVIVLERFAYSPDGTFGVMTFPTGEQFYTVERPWLGNKPMESCIPEGLYILQKRYSPAVDRSSGGEFDEGWEVTNVPGRTFIMIHPGNWPINFQGCIGVGKEYTVIPDRSGVPRNGVTRSRDAFRDMMELMETSNAWDIDIRQKVIEYP